MKHTPVPIADLKPGDMFEWEQIDNYYRMCIWNTSYKSGWREIGYVFFYRNQTHIIRHVECNENVVYLI